MSKVKESWMTNAQYISDSTSAYYGSTIVNFNTTNTNGYINTCRLYSNYGFLSVPLNNQLVLTNTECMSNVQAIGVNSTIQDENFNLSGGEAVNYSTKWYNKYTNNGISIQVAQTPNEENAVMGQSTNQVLTDIMTLLLAVVNWSMNHTHGGVITGTSTTTSPIQPTPDKTEVESDTTYISGNHNLAITDVYEPHS